MLLRSKINQITSDSDKLPSTYTLKKLAENTIITPDETATIYKLLYEKTLSDKVLVKWKALKSFKFLIEHGSLAFRLMLQRNHSFVRDLLHYKGRIDPLMGDKKNERVRNSAKDLLIALETAMNNHGQNNNSRSMMNHNIPRTSSMQSMGSHTIAKNNVSTSNYTTNTRNTSKYQGFGNPNFDNSIKATKKTYIDKQIDKVNKWAASKQRDHLAAHGIKVEDTKLGKFDSSVARTLGQGGQIATWQGKKRNKKQVGGGWDDDDNDDNISLSNTNESSLHQHQQPQPQQTYPSMISTSQQIKPSSNIPLDPNRPIVHLRPEYKKRQAKKSDGVYESRLIDTIIIPSGMRVKVPTNELNDFLQKCKSLDLYCIADILNNKLLSNSHIAQQKTLHVISELIQQGWAEIIDDYFVTNQSNIEQCEQSNNANVSKKAYKLLQMLGSRDEDEEYKNQPVQDNIFAAFENTTTTTTTTINDDDDVKESNFDFLNDETNDTTNNIENLFGDMSVQSETTTTASNGLSMDLFSTTTATTKVDPLALFDQNQANTTTTTTSNTVSNNDLFFTSSSSKSVDTSSATTSTTQVLDDPFANLTSVPQPSLDLDIFTSSTATTTTEQPNHNTSSSSMSAKNQPLQLQKKKMHLVLSH